MAIKSFENSNIIEDISTFNIDLKEINKLLDPIFDNTSINMSKIFQNGPLQLPVSQKLNTGTQYLYNIGEYRNTTKNVDLGQEESLCKKNFADIMTDFVSSEKVFNDKNMVYITRFQYLVIETYKIAINKYLYYLDKKYKKRFNRNNDIFFTYKGGTTMKILFEKYRSIFEGVNNFKDISSKFKRSDSDYSIFINPNITDNLNNNIYLEVYKDINKISIVCLTYIKKYIKEHNNEIVPLELINDEDIRDIIERMNNKLDDIKTNYEGDYNFCHKFRKIHSIIGMSYFGKQYFTDGEQIQSLTDDKIDGSIQNINNTDLQFTEFRDNGYVSTKRTNFCLTWDLHDKNNRYINPLPDTIDIYNNDDIYISINETNEYPVDELNMQLGETQFCLQRIKINFIAYYKVLNIDSTYSYGFFKCPSELVDVSIMKRASVDLHKVYEHIELEFKKYGYQNEDLHVTYKSYTTYGHISDLCNILFSQFRFPWLAGKYEKRLIRVLFFVFLDFITIYNFHHFTIISKTFYKVLLHIRKLINDGIEDNTKIPNMRIRLIENTENILKVIRTINPNFGDKTGSYKFIYNLQQLFYKLDANNINNFNTFYNIIISYVKNIYNNKDSIQKIIKQRELKRELADKRRETSSVSSGRSNNSDRPDELTSLGGNKYEKKYRKYKLKYLKLKKDFGIY